MSIPDYAQSVEDHRKVLILLKPLGSLLQGDRLTSVLDAVTTYHSLTPIPGHQDEEIPRSVQARFVRHHSAENNAWGEFQAHRQVLGLICVAGFRTQADLESACSEYAAVKEEFMLTLVDGLLVLLDLRDEKEEEEEEVTFDNLSDVLPYCSKDVLRCRGDDPNLGPLHSRVRDFMIVLFWLLESQRLNFMQKQSSRPEPTALLTAPFEKREMVGLNRDSRQFLRRQAGRQRKRVADLSLLCGLPGVALEHYHAAHDLLKVANDWLWVGACVEGQCAASAVIHYGTGDPVYAAMKATNQNARPGRGEDSGRLGVEESMLSEATRRLLDEQYTGESEDEQEERVCNMVCAHKLCFSLDSMISKYKEVIEQYKKYSMASIVCLEAGLKCCRLLIRQQDMQDFKRRLEAAAFLQKVLLVKVSGGEDTSMRYAVAGRLYELMQFPRKAAFYRRMAGLVRDLAQTEEGGVDLLAFLHKAAPAYGLQLNPETRSKEGEEQGWTALKVEHLHELAMAATRCQQWSLVINYCSYALDIGRGELSSDRLSSLLHLLCNAREAAEEQAAVHRSFFVPQVDALKLFPLASHIQPLRKESQKTTKPKSPSPFIYSPLLAPKKSHFRSRSAGGCLEIHSFRRLSEEQPEVSWVCGELSRLELTLTNPLCRDIDLSHFRLVLSPISSSDSVMWPSCTDLKVSLGAGCFKTITILIEPPTAGEFILVGWRFVVFDMEWEQNLPAGLVIAVAPRLPTLEIETSLQPADDFVESEEGRETLVADGTLSLVRGQSADFSLLLATSDSSSCDVSELRLDFCNDVRICGRTADYRKRCRVDGLLSFPDILPVPLRSGESATLSVGVTPDVLPPGAVSLETLLTVEYSSQEAEAQGWCRRHVVAIVSDLSSPPPPPHDPFAELPSPVTREAPAIRLTRVA